MSKNVSPLESADDQHQVSIRCAYVNARGHRCRTTLPDHTSEFCIHHARFLKKRELEEAAKLSDELLGSEVFQSRKDFLELFVRIFDAIVTKRISRQDGAVLAHVASRMLQCYPPLKAEENYYSRDGRPLNFYGLPIPEPVKYEQDSVTGKWRKVSPEEEAAREKSSSAEQAQSQTPAEQIPDSYAAAAEPEPEPEPPQPAPAPTPYVPPPNPHENPWGPYLRDPRPRHLRNLYPLPRRF
ncbi:MAG TPA: hypothetical protein VFO34_03955 [Candidatus Acidoferrales bacterium]|nr:hypothetical protein [Candidatus Acidoferrales bacterium]